MSHSARIKRLAQPVADAIAAGEVVERPASVVKELLENAIDAGASHIDVIIDGGGAVRIRVSDDGRGIGADQLTLAVQRHATSKISSAADLERVSSLGFRGEALASIAAVSELTLTSRPHDAPAAARLRMRGGEVMDSGIAGAAAGTSVEVCDLFFNTPARLRFLRNERTEVAVAVRNVADLILARPGVGVTCTVHGRVALRHVGGTLRDAAKAVLGAGSAAELLDVVPPEGPIVVGGTISQPRAHRGNRNALTLVVNGRRVHNRALIVAVEEAYRGLLPHNRHPYGVITVDIDHAEVDVNVHPAKREVRFRDERAVFSAVQRACWHALGDSRPYAMSPPAPGDTALSFADRPSANASASSRVRPTSGPWRPLWDATLGGTSSVIPPLIADRIHANGQPSAAADVARFPGGESMGDAIDSPPAPAGLEVLRAARAVGQIGTSWIVAEAADGSMVLMDPHAAHEKILYAELLARLDAPAAEASGSQLLLLPVLVECDADRMARFETSRHLLTACGFDVEPFGPLTLRCVGVPGIAGSADASRLIHEILDAVDDGGGEQDGRRHRVAALVACHSAVRLGDRLGLPEQQRLLDRLVDTPGGVTCPHGRPTVLVCDDASLRKAFGRPVE